MAQIDIITDDLFKTTVLGADPNTPVLVDFWAEWCGPCKMVEPTLDELAKEYAGKVIFTKVNVDDLPSIGSTYGVQSIPTLIVFKAGKEIARIIGAHPKNDYVKEITNAL